MRAGLFCVLPLLLAACATSPPARTEPTNPHGYVWIATPRASGDDDVARSGRFQERVAAALARQGYRQDSQGALAIALTFTGADAPSLGAYQGGYAVLTPHTHCSAASHRPAQPMMACVSAFHMRSGKLVGAASLPLAWDADDPSMDLALASALNVSKQGK